MFHSYRQYLYRKSSEKLEINTTSPLIQQLSNMNKHSHDTRSAIENEKKRTKKNSQKLQLKNRMYFPIIYHVINRTRWFQQRTSNRESRS